MRLVVSCLAIVAVAACSPSEQRAAEGREELAIADNVSERLRRFEPTEMRADLSELAEEDRRVLAELVTAARLMDEVFLRQVWTGNAELRAALAGLEGPNAEA